MSELATKRLARYKQLKQIKSHIVPWYQDLAELFLTRKADFTSESGRWQMTQFLQDKIFDNVGQYALFVQASTFLSYLWPDSSRTFNLVPSRRLRDKPGVEEFFKFFNEETHAYMDKPRAGLQMALMETFLEEGAFGTGGLGTFEGPKDDPDLPVVYESWNIKSMHISENAQGYVDTIYYEPPLTVRQAMEEYGPNSTKHVGAKVSARLVELSKDVAKLDEPYKVLICIEPKTPEKGKRGVAAMRYQTLHIDVEAKMVMWRGGFEENPVAVVRQFKWTGMPYGMSSAMLAYADTASRNVLAEAILVATEKQLRPPIVVIDAGRLGGAVVDTSAGGLTVLNDSGRLGGEKPIYPLFTVGEMQSADKLFERLGDQIMQAFFLDRLLDLNNQAQMTAFETSVRNRLRGESLNSVFSRQINEGLVPTIERTVNVLWRRGHYGMVSTGAGAWLRRKWAELLGDEQSLVPEIIIQAVEANLDWFEIEFISPAQRFMQAEKLQGIFTASDAIVGLAAVHPTIVHAQKPYDLARDIYKYSGAPATSLATKKEFDTSVAADGERQQAADLLQAGDVAAGMAQKTAQARASMGTAKPSGR